MKFRESGMPSLEQWEALFDVPAILDRFAPHGDIVEFGCGYGTFALPWHFGPWFRRRR